MRGQRSVLNACLLQGFPQTVSVTCDLIPVHQLPMQGLRNNHYLEYVGETIKTVEVRVAFCPSCGEKLSRDVAVMIPQFRYQNFGSR
jgi:hypothetical protein